MRPFNFVKMGLDSYKVSHPSLYPAGTQKTYLYAEARGNSRYDEVVCIGLRYWLETYFAGMVVTARQVEQAIPFMDAHFGSSAVFEPARWLHIVTEHDGKLPLRIEALAEGTRIRKGNVVFTVESTCPDCYWLPGACDTLLTQVWGPMAVATMGYHLKQTIRRSLIETGSPLDGIEFMLHDFGYRASIGVEMAAITGLAHLVNFKGTDTLAALDLVADLYDEPMAGYSVPATEHTVTITHGQADELNFFEQVVQRFPTGIVSIVIDSYDTESAIRNLLGGELREQIQARQGKVVVRPDSGDPLVMVPLVLDLLGESFGFSTNEKGFKVLPSCVGVIQGDHIYETTLQPILDAVAAAGWATGNLVFGCGEGLRLVRRSDVDFVIKCSEVTVNGAAIPVQKLPKTDPSKASKAGRFAVVKGNDGYLTTVLESDRNSRPNYLRPVFENGVVIGSERFENIRRRAAE